MLPVHLNNAPLLSGRRPHARSVLEDRLPPIACRAASDRRDAAMQNEAHSGAAMAAEALFLRIRTPRGSFGTTGLPVLTP